MHYYYIDDVTIERKIMGIYILDFLKILKKYNVLLEDDDNASMRDVFTLKSDEDYLNIENIYNHMESCISKGDPSEYATSYLDQNNKQDQLSTQEEQLIYRKIGDCLKTMKLNIEQAFKFIDYDKNEMISEIEFKKLLKSLHVLLSDREINILISQLQLIKGIIPKQAFIEKFWNAYAPIVIKKFEILIFIIIILNRKKIQRGLIIIGYVS